jgi:DNA-binding NarL/FixJ family response regulator
VDDHPVASAGVSAGLMESGDIEIVGVARALGEIAPLVARVRPDVVLCDIQLGQERALDVARHLGAQAPPVIFFTSYEYPAYVRAAVESGAAGYVLKSAPIEEVIAAIRTVAAGGTAYASRHLRGARGAPRVPSDREQQVIALVSRGRTNAEIGEELGIDERTVESHLRRLFDRYGVDSRTKLVFFCAQNGWVDLGSGA